jgi:dihydropteroate synthase
VAGGPAVMGILNVTPDSFSDGGRFEAADAAVARGLELVAGGADIVDVGGESTRPGADAVSVRDELSRVVPVIEALSNRSSAVLSIDTMKAPVARAALEAGAHIVNDVSACTHDADMASVVAEYGAGVVLMHMWGTPRTMQEDPRYEDVVQEVSDYLAERRDALVGAGVDRLAVAVDPGIGFGKTLEHNLSLLRGLEQVGACGAPVVVGLSRKSFLGKLTGREVGGRLASSIAALAWCVMKGADVMRVHDVRDSRDAVTVVKALAGRCPAGIREQVD